MIKKILVLSMVLVAVVNCSSDKDKHVGQTIPSDTPTEFIDKDGNVVDTKDPAQDPAQEQPAATTDELIKQTWNDLGFGEQFLMSELIGPDVCSLSEKQFVGCFFAAHYLTTFAYGPEHVLVVTGQKDEEFVGEVVHSSGFLSVHKIPVSKVDMDDAQEVSKLEKRKNDFFKKTVQAAIAIYKSDVANNELAQKAITGFKKDFPESLTALDQAIATKDSASISKAQKHVVEVVNAINENRAALGKGLYSSYVELVSKAFANIPKTDHGIESRYTYNTYLRHSADGHARIDLDETFKAQLAKQSSTPATQYGIGTSLVQKSTGLYASPLHGSSAEAAGIQDNDRIVSVDGVEPKDINDAVVRIKGAPDTDVTITVERWSDKKQYTYTIKRAPIQSSTYTLKTKVVNGKTYGMITIATFMDDQMASAVREFVKANDGVVDGYIMDLRNNGGGLLDQAVDLCGVFLPQGSPIVAESLSTDADVMDVSTMKLTSAPQATTKELIVLINGGSASASEVVSGLLQEYKRAIIMGTQSFGKGTIQRSGWTFHPDIPEYEVWDQFSTMQMTIMGPRKFTLVNFWKTIGRYFYPSGRTPEWVGVTPDVVVDNDPLSEDLFDAREKDLIPFSFGDLGSSWVQERADFVTKIKECVDTQGLSVKTWNKDESSKPYQINYQERYAYDALKCI